MTEEEILALKVYNLEIIKKPMEQNSKTIVDVRTPGEFRMGNVAGSINIPLQEIQIRLDEIKKLPQPLLLCCASGGRSAQATAFLKSVGIHCENAGSWMNLN